MSILMTLAYRFGDSLYLNITNKCCCACTFCIRIEHEGVGSGDSLWLEREPTAPEVIAAIDQEDLDTYDEVVFCGYGEPTESLEVLLEVCRHLRATAPHMPVRLNTNGLGDVINQRPVAPLLKGLLDTVSISLNAPDPQRYKEIVRPAFGADSFDHMLRFATACKEYVPQVQFTVVDVISPQEIQRCQELSQSMGIPLRVRQKT